MALPADVDGGLLYYRKDLLDRYGVPQPPASWEELSRLSGRIQNGERKTRPDFFGYVWQGAQYEGMICNFLKSRPPEAEAFRSGGPDHGQFSGQRARLPRMQDAIHKRKDFPPADLYRNDGGRVRQYFQQGNALFERNWPYAWMLHQAADSPVRGKVGIAPLPHFVPGESASTLGGWHIGISRFSTAKEDAWQLVKFVMSFEIQKRAALELGWNPGRKEVIKTRRCSPVCPKFAHYPASLKRRRSGLTFLITPRFPTGLSRY